METLPNPAPPGNAATLEILQNPQAEAIALGHVIADPARADYALQVLNADLFNDLRHRSIFAAMLKARAAGKQIDEATIFAHLPDDEARVAVGTYAATLVDLGERCTDFDALAAGLQNLAGKRRAGEDDFRRLAALTRTAYDQVRRQEAKRLGIRPATLDDEVEARRSGSGDGQPELVPVVDPWPEPVVGSEILSACAERIGRFVSLPPEVVDVVALWVAHSFCYDSFTHTPRLNIRSAEKGSGKSTLRGVLGELVARPLSAENVSTAVVFRVTDKCRPTLLCDEYDAWIGGNEELRGLLNAGHTRGAQVLRCEGDDLQVRAFKCFAPVVLCGIGALPGTLHDRSIVVEMRRALPGELRHRFDSRRTQPEKAVGRKLARWANDNGDALAESDPTLPPGCHNRKADCWRPLFAIAAQAGGDWPTRAAAGFAHLSATDPDDDGLPTMLLADVRLLFAEARVERLFSADLVERLVALGDRPWAEANRGRPISEAWLARKLKSFGAAPITLRIADQRKKGYQLGDLGDAFARYLPGEGAPKRDSVTTQAGVEKNDFAKCDTVFPRHASETQKTPTNIDLSRCHASVGGDGTVYV